MVSSRVTFRRKTRTIQQPQPNDAKPNTAESMVGNAHRTSSFMRLASSVTVSIWESKVARCSTGSPVLQYACWSLGGKQPSVNHSTSGAVTSSVQCQSSWSSAMWDAANVGYSGVISAVPEFMVIIDVGCIQRWVHEQCRNGSWDWVRHGARV